MRTLTLGLLALFVASTAHAVEYTTVLPKQSRVDFEFRQMGVLRRGQGQALATGPAASGYHLE